MTAAPEGFGVYVHWPYCARICPYCDFNVRKDRGVDAAQWISALTRDLDTSAERTGPRRLTSLYFGGGTPSLAPPAVIDAVIAACERLWGFDGDPEITIEANPTDAETGAFEAFRAAGVNRLSLGVQSFDDKALRFLGRNHDAAGARLALDRAFKVFPRVSADFIYVRPGQTLDQWADELQAALATGIRHLSLYQLTIEEGVAFGRQVAKGRWAPPGEDDAADLFDLTQALTEAAGLPAYEISNHAAAGEASRHNLTYWRQGDYVGVGPGAHGRLTIDGTRHAIETLSDPARYLAQIAETGCGAAAVEALSAESALTERLAMGLRTIEGAALGDAARVRLAGRLDTLAAEGWLSEKNGRLIASAEGRRLLDALLARLLG